MESSYPRVKGDRARLESPFFVEKYKCFKVRYILNGADMGRLNIYVKTQGEREKLRWRISGPQGDGWTWARVPVESSGPFKVITI